MAVERVFVGRARELEQLTELVGLAERGRGSVALLAGEAGIGKTRLAARVATIAEQRGFRVAWGRCWEAGGAAAYFPWSQVFAGLALPDPFAAAETGVSDAGELRFRRFETAAGQLAEAAAAAPIAVVLDDLHAADLPSLGFLHALARRVASARLLVVGTYREIEARIGDSGAAIAKIGREGDVIALDRLSRDETLAWVRTAAPAASAEEAARVWDASEGNPLFVHEMLRVRKQLDVRRLPSGLHALIGEHVARVPAGGRDILAVASVLGREVTIAEVAALAALEPDRVAADLQAACDAGLVEPTAADAFAFTHALVRDHLYAQLPPSRRAHLHWRAGELARDPARAAHHLLAGREAGDLQRVAEVSHDAARAALARFAFEDAIRLAASALDVLEGQPSTTSCQLELVQADALIRNGEGDRGRAACVRAEATARALGSPELAAQAALVYGSELRSSLVDPTMVRLLRDALAGLAESSDDTLRARVMARLAAALTPPSVVTHREAMGYGREALAIARRCSDPRTHVFVGYHVLNAHYYHHVRSERDAIVDAVIEHATALGDELVLLDLAGLHFANLRERGRADDADAVIERFRARVRDLPRPRYQWRVPAMDATRALLAGDLDAARRLGDEALAIAERGKVGHGEVAWAQHRIALAAAMGEPGSITDVADKVLAILQRSTGLRLFTPWVLAASGRHDDARARLDEYARGYDHAFDRVHFIATLLTADVARWIDDRVLAERIFQVLADSAPDELTAIDTRGVFWGSPASGTVLGPIARAAADLAVYLGRLDEARVLYNDAIATCEQIGAVPLARLARQARDAIGTRSGPRSGVRATLTRSGDHWTLALEGRTRVLKARKGLDYLARLLAEPRRELHVLELSSDDAPRDHGAPLLDAKAKATYRARIEELREIADGCDGERAERARVEIDAIAGELARALGLGGRDRTTATAADRARAAVTLAIRRAIEAIGEHEPALAGHLEIAVRTGMFCAYRPDPRADLSWSVTT